MISTDTLFAQMEKPDLIISNVELKYVRTNHTHKPGEPVRGSDNLPHPMFYITVKNIGNKDFSDPFFIVYTNDENAIRNGRYTKGSIVNTQKNTIKANDSFIFRIGGLYGNNYKCKFYIQSEGKPNDNHTWQVDELNYDNNTYECSFNK
jgi:hypothetical protein